MLVDNCEPVLSSSFHCDCLMSLPAPPVPHLLSLPVYFSLCVLTLCFGSLHHVSHHAPPYAPWVSIFVPPWYVALCFYFCIFYFCLCSVGLSFLVFFECINLHPASAVGSYPITAFWIPDRMICSDQSHSWSFAWTLILSNLRMRTHFKNYYY